MDHVFRTKRNMEHVSEVCERGMSRGVGMESGNVRAFLSDEKNKRCQ